MSVVQLPEAVPVSSAIRNDLLEVILINVFENPDDFENYVRQNPELNTLYLMDAESEEHVRRYLKVCLERNDIAGLRSVARYCFSQDNIPLLREIRDVDINDVPFHHCIFDRVVGLGYVDMIRYLIERGLDANMRYFGKSILHHACTKNKIDIVRILLEHGADPNDEDETSQNDMKYFTSSLHGALLSSCVGIVDLLICHGVYLYKYPALMWISAARSRDVAKIERLRGMNIPIPDDIIEQLEETTGVRRDDLFSTTPAGILIASYVEEDRKVSSVSSSSSHV